jgi:hypothetical protein
VPMLLEEAAPGHATACPFHAEAGL